MKKQHSGGMMLNGYTLSQHMELYHCKAVRLQDMFVTRQPIINMDSYWQLLGEETLATEETQDIQRVNLSLQGCACQSHVSFSRF
jgi:hypothetical protein